MALNRVWIPSPNYSSRGSGVRLIVIHTAEGARTYQSLGNFFASPSAGVSSHTGIDDTPNTVGEYVNRGNKAWTAANANPYAIQTELCAFASWDINEWNRHPVMLENCAKWIAEEAAQYGIPIRKLNASQAQGGTAGVCGHNELGAMGGGHWDPGPSFPMDRVLQMATGGAPAAPQPVREEGEIVAVKVHNCRNNEFTFQVNKAGQLYRKVRGQASNPNDRNSYNNQLVSAMVWGGNTDQKVQPNSLEVTGDENSVSVMVELDPTTVVRRYFFRDDHEKPNATDLP